jgi:hypothetical protein
MSEISIPGICYQQKLLEQLLQRFERNGKRVQSGGIIFEVGCCDGNVPFYGGANPEDATTTTMTRVRDTNTG